MPPPHPLSPAGRDRALRRIRTVHRIAGVTVAGATAGLSLLASHAFKGHAGNASAATVPAVVTAPTPRPAVQVPPPEAVPAIAGDPAPLEPPPAAPQPSPQAAVPEPAPAPPPVVSGGS